ncbi:MAG: hypothetical protein DYG96_09625 [Chlorobi bacterium CHB2]|nr:hypothetical protein [Chlorobi bacterium CHB2]
MAGVVVVAATATATVGVMPGATTAAMPRRAVATVPATTASAATAPVTTAATPIHAATHAPMVAKISKGSVARGSEQDRPEGMMGEAATSRNSAATGPAHHVTHKGPVSVATAQSGAARGSHGEEGQSSMVRHNRGRALSNVRAESRSRPPEVTTAMADLRPGMKQGPGMVGQ